MQFRYFICFYLFAVCQLFPQKDILVLDNGDKIIGEIKSLNAGVLTMETGYSDSDFSIEFNKVVRLDMERKCFVVLTQGRRRFGNINSPDDNKIQISLEDGSVEIYNINELVILQEVDDVFWQRFTAAVDVGLTLAKAQNTTQFTIGSELDYTGEKWLFEGDMNILNSTQDDAERIKRSDANLELLRLLPKKWYLLGNIGYLSNTEQALNSRYSPSIGFGRLLITTNKLYMALSTGFNYNIENFAGGTEDRSSSEVFVTLSFNMFDFEDIDLDTRTSLYPSLSENGRMRLDYDISIKYDLPLDFFIKLGFTLNYDNQPAAGGSQTDYVLTSGFGWEFN